MEAYVIIDNGHGCDTAGKCSPDGALLEWQWTRIIARRIQNSLINNGIASCLLVPEDMDTSLRERCRRANVIYAQHPDAVLISLHTNAAGTGKEWRTASGWSVYTALKASVNSLRLAKLLYAKARAFNLLGNRATPQQGYYRANLAICRNTLCPAVLTENLFHDNAVDVAFLLSEKGQETIVQLHVEALIEFFKHRV